MKTVIYIVIIRFSPQSSQLGEGYSHRINVPPGREGGLRDNRTSSLNVVA